MYKLLYNLFTTTVFLIISFKTVECEISDSLQKECLSSPEKSFNIILELFPIDKSKFSSNPEIFIQSLKSQSWESQRSVINAIQSHHLHENSGGDIHSFWIANRLALTASCSFLEFLSNIPGVKTVRKEVVSSLHMIGEAEVADWEISSKIDEANPQWGVQKIGANEVWSHPGQPTQGNGIVVANIDTGVRGSHEALKSNYRGGDYSWLDGTRNSSEGSPNDGHGHGTHTMGSICGTKGIGVAPGVKWMACKGCGTSGCSEKSLLTCGQWTCCPYYKSGNRVTTDCNKRPNVVSNSWGAASEEGANNFYKEVIDNWERVGIVPFFSIGNSGPSCRSTASPASQGGVISVGATNSADAISNFSSRGPSPFHQGTSPDISAPGEKIFSAWQKNDTSYATISGTSMSCPHAAGMAALLLAKNPRLNSQQILKSMIEHAFKPAGDTQCDNCASSTTCSSTGSMPYPNFIYGYGRISAIDSYKAI